jgi:hypothetical protein
VFALRHRQADDRHFGNEHLQIAEDLPALVGREIEQHDVRMQIADAADCLVVIWNGADDVEAAALREHQLEAFPV